MRTECPACKSTKEVGHFQDGEWNTWVICAGCGGWYNKHRFPAEGFKQMMEKSAKDRSTLVEAMRRTAEKVWRFFNASMWDRMVARGNYLEIGSSWGYLAGLAIANGWKVTCIEPAAAARDESVKRFPGLVPMDEFLETWETETKYDLVVAMEVIEHCENPLLFLKRLTDVTSDEGRLVLSTPNVESPIGQIYQGKWGGIIGEHIYLFGFSFLKKMLAENGLDVIGCADLAEANGYSGNMALVCAKKPRLEELPQE